MFRLPKCHLLLIVIMIVVFVLTACSSEQASSSPAENGTVAEGEASGEETQTDPAGASGYQPVTIENNGRTLSFDKPPQRAVTLNQHVTEVMLALGLEEVMVGTAYLDDEILPQFQEAYEQIPVLADRYPSQEVFLSVEPDFAYAGWQSAFSENGVGSVEELEAFGVTAYLHHSSTIVGPTIEDVYQDIRNIGRIFGVEERAEELIAQMETDIALLQEQIGKVDEPIRVFVYDSGEDQAFTVGQNYMNTLIRLAGGENIFADLDKNWGSVNWEEVVERSPEVIVVVDYGEMTAEQKIDFLLRHPALDNVPAIQHERFVVVPLSAAAEGIRAPLALEILIKGFYPEKAE
ncbi:lipoprotein [Caldalkalibacillus thermarum]|uniref:ABC transporter substrate-binding protein n=1 Tax=Caldalkalibacillus thermarum TaxID=296745 RepID=UPI0016637081|nr:ABC transporter substrate-binding protein [Caldalkalibacillus thermarum]GGK23385.1 lipoprotein [Caldalkalibacillus thermarum]